MRRTWCALGSALALSLMVSCGGAAAPKVEAPPPPTPPSEPLAWMPLDASLLAHVTLGPFRGTPLWSLWEAFQRQQAALTAWIDTNLADEVTLGGAGLEGEQPSFVAVLRGRFGASYLEQLAQRDQVAAETHGLLRVYRRPEALFCQLSPELLLVFSADRLLAAAARASGGPGTPIKQTALYTSLGERVGFERDHLALIVDDAEGKGRARLEENTAQLGLGSIPDEVIRAGASMSMGPTVSFGAVAEAATPEGAQKVQRKADHALSGLANNMFVAMFGLRPAISALKTETQGNHVFVRGSMPEAELNALLGKLRSLLNVASSQGTPLSATP